MAGGIFLGPFVFAFTAYLTISAVYYESKGIPPHIGSYQFELSSYNYVFVLCGAAFSLSLFVFFWSLIGSRNLFISCDEDLITRRNNLDLSIERKGGLNSQLLSVANKLSSVEMSTHTTITKDLSNAATEIGTSKSPSILLANLAAQFPTLNSNTSFLNVQQNAKEIEANIDSEVRGYNNVIATYNDAVRAFPTNVLAGWFGAAVRERYKL